MVAAHPRGSGHPRGTVPVSGPLSWAGPPSRPGKPSLLSLLPSPGGPGPCSHAEEEQRSKADGSRGPGVGPRGPSTPEGGGLTGGARRTTAPAAALADRWRENARGARGPLLSHGWGAGAAPPASPALRCGLPPARRRAGTAKGRWDLRASRAGGRAWAFAELHFARFAVGDRFALFESNNYDRCIPQRKQTANF